MVIKMHSFVQEHIASMFLSMDARYVNIGLLEKVYFCMHIHSGKDIIISVFRQHNQKVKGDTFNLMLLFNDILI